MKESKFQPFQRRILPLLFIAAAFTQPLATQARYSPQFLQNSFAPWSSQTTSSGQNYVNDIRRDGLFSWTEDHFPLKVCIQPGYGVPGYRDSFAQIIANSFDQWVAASDGKLSWQQVDSPQEADIVVSWINSPTERSEGTEIGKTRTYTRYNPTTGIGTIMRADMRLLTRLPERELTDMEIKKAYLHEVGHAFGIAGHSQNPNDIMYYTVSSNHGPTLSQRDVGTLQALYEHNHRLTASTRSRSGMPQALENRPLSRSSVLEESGARIVEQAGSHND